MSKAWAARLLLAGALAAGLAACERQERSAEETGPAERAGEQLDQALTRAGDELNKVAEKTGKNLQELGRRLQDEAREARQARAQRQEQERQEQQRQAARQGAERTSGE